MNSESSKVSLDDIYKLIKEVKGDLASKIENINKDVKTLTNKIEAEFKVVKDRVDNLEEENFQLKQKLEVVERKLKSSNLVFFGIEERDRETQNSLISKIKTIVNDCMEIALDTPDVSNCYRIGKRNSKNRPALITLTTQIKRREILKNAKKLKGTNIYVKEDLIEKDIYEQKVLFNHLKIARNNNKKGFIKGNKLYIDGQIYSVQDLEGRQNQILYTSGYYSPPAVRLTNSAPPTPVIQSTLSDDEDPIGDTIITNKEESVLQNEQSKNDKTKKENTRKPSVDQIPKRSQPTRSATYQKNK